MTRVGLVGPGRVGRSVAGLLPSRQFQLGPVISRTLHSAKRAVRDLGKGSACNDWASLRECDLVLVCVPDAVGPAVLDVIGRHCSPVTPPRILYTGRTLEVTQKFLVRSARFYPLRVFQRQVLDLSGVSFAISGDRAGLAAARKVARALGGQTLVLSPDRLEQAVIGASLASDALTGLLELAVQRIVAAGVPRGRAVDAVHRLVDSSLDDFLRSGPRTRPGPLLEGRSATVQSLLDVCRSDDPIASELYRTALQLSLDALGSQNESFDFLAVRHPRTRRNIRASQSSTTVHNPEAGHQLSRNG